MKIRTNTIITLENNEQYMVLNQTEYEGFSYYLVMGLDQNKEIIENNVAIFKEEIDKEYEGDAFFPRINEEIWKEVSRENKIQKLENGLSYSFAVYEKN